MPRPRSPSHRSRRLRRCPRRHCRRSDRLTSHRCHCPANRHSRRHRHRPSPRRRCRLLRLVSGARYRGRPGIAASALSLARVLPHATVRLCIIDDQHRPDRGDGPAEYGDLKQETEQRQQGPTCKKHAQRRNQDSDQVFHQSADQDWRSCCSAHVRSVPVDVQSAFQCTRFYATHEIKVGTEVIWTSRCFGPCRRGGDVRHNHRHELTNARFVVSRQRFEL
jgi:hypothetical protein